MPRHPLEYVTLPRFRQLMSSGQRAAGKKCLLEALAQEGNLPGVHVALARLRWPGPDYRHWLAWFHEQLRPRVYLEIGVERGDSLALAKPPTRAIGVDPMPLGDPLGKCIAPTRLFRQESTRFLASPPEDAGLREERFDLAFIDGDHRFESVLNDFIGLEALAAPEALILLHDTLPLTSLTAGGERRSGFYSGDGWKLVLCLKALRPDLRVITLPVAPTGLTIVTGLNPHSTVLREQEAVIRTVYARLPAERIIARPSSVVDLGVADRQWVKDWLRKGVGQ